MKALAGIILIIMIITLETFCFYCLFSAIQTIFDLHMNLSIKTMVYFTIGTFPIQAILKYQEIKDEV